MCQTLAFAHPLLKIGCHTSFSLLSCFSALQPPCSLVLCMNILFILPHLPGTLIFVLQNCTCIYSCYILPLDTLVVTPWPPLVTLCQSGLFTIYECDTSLNRRSSLWQVFIPSLSSGRPYLRYHLLLYVL